MKKKTALFLCLILLISTIGTGCSSKKDAIRFGAADIGGIYYTFANAYAGLVNNDAPDYSIEAKKTAGSAANLYNQIFLPRQSFFALRQIGRAHV